MSGEVVGIDLSYLGLQGSIPSEIGCLHGLTGLHLGHNSIIGTIPTEVGLLENLKVVGLNENLLSGTVPSEFCTLRKFSNLSFVLNDQIDCYSPCLTLFGRGNLQSGGVGMCGRNGTAEALCAFLAATDIGSVHSDWQCDAFGVPSSFPCVDSAVWTGLTCASGEVVSLNIINAGLNGTLPQSLGALTALTTLDVSNNRLSGSLPTRLGSLPFLVRANFYNNKFSGLVPEQMGSISTLTRLRLEVNDFSGQLPDALGCLTNLIIFGANTNKLTGPIPHLLGQSGTLQYFTLSENSVSGTIPSSLCASTDLTYFKLYLSPNVVCYPDCLTSISIDNRNFGGASGVCATGNNASLCDFVAGTNVSSVVSGGGNGVWECNRAGSPVSNPCSWFGVSCTNNEITGISLYGQGIGGTLPASIGEMTTLSVLALHFNSLRGTLPPSLGALTRLTTLKVASNCFTGTLPVDLGSLTLIQRLDFGVNNINGSVPSAFGCLTALTRISLFHLPLLSGEIPTELWNITTLQDILLNDSPLVSGAVPRSVCNAGFAYNSIKLNNSGVDCYPGCLETIGALADAGGTMMPSVCPPTDQDTALCGVVAATNGQSLFSEWACRTDGVTVTDPCDPGYFWAGLTCTDGVVTRLYFSGALNGTIPSSLGLLSHITGMTIYQTSLTGELPSQLALCTKLVTLWMSHNHLSGSLPDLGSLSLLETLDLSSNAFSGHSRPATTGMPSLESSQSNR